MKQQETAKAMYLEGERIYLREVRPTDVNDTYYRWMNDPAVTRFLESRFAPNALESLRNYVAGKLGDRDNVFLAIILKESDRHIGNIKLGPINWIHRYGDVGLIIGEKDCWGKGYASEAIHLITRYAFMTLGLHRLTAGCYAPNAASAKAFLKAGWRQEGRRESIYFLDGAYVDVILLGVIADSWQA